jgi:V/A-type H+-transporting ATPase subunit I
MGLLSPEKMIVAKVVSHRDLERNVLLALEEFGLFEFIDVRRQAGLIEVKRTRDEESVFSASDRLDKLVDTLGLSAGRRSGKLLKIDDSTLQNSLNLASEVIEAVEKEVFEIDTDLIVARGELERQHGIVAVASSLSPLGIDPSYIGASEYTFTTAGLIPSGREEELEWSLNEVTEGAFALNSYPIKSGAHACVITVSIEMRDAVERILTALEFEAFTIPEGESGKPEEIIEASEKRMEELKEEIESLVRRKDTIASEWGHRILAAWETLSIEKKRIEVKGYIVYTDQSIKMWGWIPDRKEAILESLLRERVGTALQVTFDKPEFAEHEAPTYISNPSFMQPTEDVVKAFGVPSRHDLDPTKIMWLTFPIIFGLIFSDVGQGFLVILIGLAALRAKKKGQDWGSILGYVQNGAEGLILMGIFAMIGGFLFGSFFGSETVIEPLWPAFAHSVAGVDNVYRDSHMLKLSIEVGAIHISLGIVLNLYNKLKHKEYRNALIAASYLWLYLGFVNLLFGVSYNSIGNWFSSSGNVYLWIPIVGIGYGTGNNGIYPALPISPMLFSIVLFIIPLIIMAITSLAGGMDSIVVLLENAIGMISHTVSYARIFALNTVHVILSSVFMQLPAVIMITFPALELFGVEIIPHEFIIDGVHMQAGLPLLGAVIGSLLVGILEGLLGFMHTLRLHYVEWFSKFYHAGGVEFMPFRAKRFHTAPSKMEPAQIPYVYG